MLGFRMVSAWGCLSLEGVQVLFGTRDELPAVLLQYRDSPKEMWVYGTDLDFLFAEGSKLLAAFLHPFPYAAGQGEE